MSQNAVRRLRPYLFHGFKRSQGGPLRRTFITSRVACQQQAKAARDVTHDYEKRLAQLEAYKPRDEWHPRLSAAVRPGKISVRDFRQEYGSLEKDQMDDSVRTVIGRVQAVRTAGSKLVFLDIKDGDHTVQAVVQLKHVESSGGNLDQLKAFARVARKGDWFSFTGHPHRTSSGELSILANELPILISPSLHQIPEVLQDPEARARQRHVDMLVNQAAIQTLRVRHIIERTMHDFFNSKDFVKVSTPILQAGAGGAVARPFETEATELQGEKLNLRIAPELWLKRLVVGGMDRVYEIGPVFRNEGVDATHNPEFTICEFYAAKASLEELMRWSEALLVSINASVAEARQSLQALDMPGLDLKAPFQVLDFIPALEDQMNQNLPDLSSPTASSDLNTLFATLKLDIPSKPTLPRLLDSLASHYLEPLCTTPTFITNHPAALSPLSKTYTCPTTGQLISARAELFIAGREIANMYEEENSPFAQRAKFEAQLEFRKEDGEGDGRREVDEGYLAALEWGLPPTGGWGCGIERLVCVFSGRQRVGEVLSFGGLRNVVAAGRR